jgi:RimJ/RimL family protein N-acetyltransferase
VIVAAPTLVGERVMLRPYSAGFSAAELARVFGWACDPAVLALAGGLPVDLSFEAFRDQFLDQLPRHNSEKEQVFVVLDETGAAIGRAGLFALEQRRRPHEAELGIVIGERSHWGRGYGREAVRLLVRFGFEDVGLERITLYTYPENVRARRAFEAAGFRFVRSLRRFSFERGSHTEHEMEAVRAPRSPVC